MSGDKYKVRAEEPADIKAIYDLTVKAFKDVAHTDHTEQFIVDALRKADVLTVSLVAEKMSEIIGHVAISPVTISDGSKNWYGLGPISVSPDHQRNGIGSALMREAMDKLKSIGADGCVLLGEPAYYSRFGFKPESCLVYPGVPAEYFQALSFCSTIPQGIVSYHKAFEAKD